MQKKLENVSNFVKKPKGKFLNQFCHIVTPSFINCANQMHWLNGSNCSVIKVKIQMFFYAAGNAQNKDQFESIFLSHSLQYVAYYYTRLPTKMNGFK